MLHQNKTKQDKMGGNYNSATGSARHFLLYSPTHTNTLIHTLVSGGGRWVLRWVYCTHCSSPVGSTWRGSRSWSKPLRVLSTSPSLCRAKANQKPLRQSSAPLLIKCEIQHNNSAVRLKADCNYVSLRHHIFLKKISLSGTLVLCALLPTCFSQPWTAVCNHQRASDSSPWKASERCRWGHGWSCEHTHTHRQKRSII